MPTTNTNLGAAKKAKNDEFYTRMEDIQVELAHYRHHFKNKTVLCNCDDPYESNFFTYFALNFNFLGLKKLIATSYCGSSLANTTYTTTRTPYIATMTRFDDANGDRATDMSDVKAMMKDGRINVRPLTGTGDFRSDECLAFLDEADIVATNPPFSLFREFIATLMEHDKKFLVLGNINATTYKEIFPLIKNNQMWPGHSFNKTMTFSMPENYQSKTSERDERGRKIGKVPAIAWYTNLDTPKRHEEMILFRSYYGHEQDYPTYDNYDAIEVSKVRDIPGDYTGVMGVPITFLGKYNPDQFEILGSHRWCKSPDLLALYIGTCTPPESDKKTLIGGKETYSRIFIRRR